MYSKLRVKNLLAFVILFSSNAGDRNNMLEFTNAEYILEKYNKLIGVKLRDLTSQEDVDDMISSNEQISKWVKIWGEKEFDKVKSILLFITEVDKLIASAFEDKYNINKMSPDFIIDIFYQYIGDFNQIPDKDMTSGLLHPLLRQEILDPLMRIFFPEKTNEFFRGGAITNALIKDISKNKAIAASILSQPRSHIFSQKYDIQMVSALTGEVYKTDDLMEAIDHSLTNVKLELKKGEFKYNLVDIDNLAVRDYPDLADDYDLKDVILGIGWDDKTNSRSDIKLCIKLKTKIDTFKNKIQRFNQFLTQFGNSASGSEDMVYHIATLYFGDTR